PGAAHARPVTLAACDTPPPASRFPLHPSAALSPSTLLCELPVQCVVADWKVSAGHVPDVPVHVSATSHWPADARHVTVAAWYTSTHALLVPVQWSAESSSHDRHSVVQGQCVVADWQGSAGYDPAVPVHVSDTSHWPADA